MPNRHSGDVAYWCHEITSAPFRRTCEASALLVILQPTLQFYLHLRVKLAIFQANYFVLQKHTRHGGCTLYGQWVNILGFFCWETATLLKGTVKTCLGSARKINYACYIVEWIPHSSNFVLPLAANSLLFWPVFAHHQILPLAPKSLLFWPIWQQICCQFICLSEVCLGVLYRLNPLAVFGAAVDQNFVEMSVIARRFGCKCWSKRFCQNWRISMSFTLTRLH